MTTNRNANTDLLKTRKTRIESLDDRINEADNTLNSYLPENTDNQSAKKMIERMQKMLQELSDLQNKSQVDPAEVESEIASLPSRSLLALSVAKIAVVNENKKLQDEKKERDDYVNRLEGEIVRQRLELEQAKKTENDNIVKISTLEDQIRILKSKAFGFDISKKYEYYKDKTGGNQAGNIEDENLAYAMWEKENYDSRKAPSSLNKLEQSNNMWISNSNKNIDKVVYDVDVANSMNGIGGVGAANGNGTINSVWGRRNNQQNSSIGTNMRKFTPMIMSNNKY